MKLKKICAGCIILAALACTVISCIVLTDQDPGYDQLMTQFLPYLESINTGSMEFHVNGELISYNGCYWDDEYYLRIWSYDNSPYTYLDIHLDDFTIGEIGDHNQSNCQEGEPCERICFISSNRIQYYGQGYQYVWELGDQYVGGYSTIHISVSNELTISGTFSGRVCNLDDTTDCFTIENGSFTAFKK